MFKKKQSKNIPYAQKLIPCIIVAVVGYTVAALTLQFTGHGEASPELTRSYFTFFGVELVSIAAIKGVKVRENKKRNIAQDGEDGKK